MLHVVSQRGWKYTHKQNTYFCLSLPSSRSFPLFFFFFSAVSDSDEEGLSWKAHFVTTTSITYSSPANIPPVHRQIASIPGSVLTHKPGSRRARKRGRPGLIHHMSDEWVIIHETWPVQRVQSKNAVSSSNCTTMLLTALWSSSHECVHGCYTGCSREPYVIIVSTSHPPDVTHMMNETKPSPLFTLFRFRVLYEELKRGRPGNEPITLGGI